MSGVTARLVTFPGTSPIAIEVELPANSQPRLDAFALPVGVVALSLYNGYFGAGSGVMSLTLLLVLVDHHLPTANALKNMLIGAASLMSAAIFALSGSTPAPGRPHRR